MANVLEFDDRESKFELQLHYYVPFLTNTLGKGIKKGVMTPVMVLVVPLLFFYKYDFAFKSPTKVDMSLNKETKPNQTYQNSFKHALTNRKLTRISVLIAKRTIQKKINVSFIVRFCRGKHSFSFNSNRFQIY